MGAGARLYVDWVEPAVREARREEGTQTLTATGRDQRKLRITEHMRPNRRLPRHDYLKRQAAKVTQRCPICPRGYSSSTLGIGGGPTGVWRLCRTSPRWPQRDLCITSAGQMTDTDIVPSPSFQRKVYRYPGAFEFSEDASKRPHRRWIIHPHLAS